MELIILEALAVAASDAQAPGVPALSRVPQIINEPSLGSRLKPMHAHSIWSMLNYFKQCTQSCPILCGPINYRRPGSSVHWILQARILE